MNIQTTQNHEGNISCDGENGMGETTSCSIPCRCGDPGAGVPGRSNSEDRLVALADGADARPNSRPDCPVDRFETSERERGKRENEGVQERERERDRGEEQEDEQEVGYRDKAEPK